MKTDRGSFRMSQRKQLLQERVHDTYKSVRKLAGPAACPGCGAVYRRGRWRWEPAPRGALPATSDAHLARRIGDALHDAYKGELRYRYNKGDGLLRVSWAR